MELFGFENILKILEKDKESKELADRAIAILPYEAVEHFNDVIDFEKKHNGKLPELSEQFEFNFTNDTCLTASYTTSFGLKVNFEVEQPTLGFFTAYLLSNYALDKQIKTLKNNETREIALVCEGNGKERINNSINLVNKNNMLSVELSNNKGKKTLVQDVKAFLAKESEPTL